MGFLSSLGPAIMTGLGGALGGLPGAVIGGGVSYLFNSMSQNRQNSLQQRNNRYWADYNSPINQMARLRAAGLNPALVYGNGQLANTYQAQNSVSAPQNHFSLEEGLSSAMLFEDLKKRKKENTLLDKNIKSVEEDIKGKQLDNTRKEASNPIQMGMNDLQSIINDNNLKLEEITRRNTVNENLRIEQGIKKVEKQLIDLDLDFKSTYGRGKAYLDMLNSQASLEYAKLQNDTYLERWLYQKNYTNAQIEEIEATISNLKALKKLNDATKDKTNAVTDNLKIDHSIKVLEAKLKGYTLPAEIIDAYVTPVTRVVGSVKGGFTSNRTQNNIIYNYGE